MNQKRKKEKTSIRMSSAVPRSCGFLSWTKTGGLEIEHFDHGDTAQSWFGNDIAIIYTIAAEDIQALMTLSPMPIDSTDTREKDEQLRLLASAYSDVDKLIATLKSSGIAFSTKFDSWA
tara:strand:+ start:688 stop:1044 length:357 start_codon:yes stop_codon:yes gene_type:complete